MRKKIFLCSTIFGAVFGITLSLLNISSIITKIILLCFGIIIIVSLPAIITQLTVLRLSNKYFSLLLRQYNLVVKLHQDRYKSYFENNSNKTNEYCKLFTRASNELLNALEDKFVIDNMVLSSKRFQNLKNIRKKTTEMKEKEFIDDYSV